MISIRSASTIDKVVLGRVWFKEIEPKSPSKGGGALLTRVKTVKERSLAVCLVNDDYFPAFWGIQEIKQFEHLFLISLSPPSRCEADAG